MLLKIKDDNYVVLLCSNGYRKTGFPIEINVKTKTYYSNTALSTRLGNLPVTMPVMISIETSYHHIPHENAEGQFHDSTCMTTPRNRLISGIF